MLVHLPYSTESTVIRNLDNMQSCGVALAAVYKNTLYVLARATFTGSSEISYSEHRDKTEICDRESRSKVPGQPKVQVTLGFKARVLWVGNAYIFVLFGSGPPLGSVDEQGLFLVLDLLAICSATSDRERTVNTYPQEQMSNNDGLKILAPPYTHTVVTG